MFLHFIYGVLLIWCTFVLYDCDMHVIVIKIVWLTYLTNSHIEVVLLTLLSENNNTYCINLLLAFALLTL